ncbi:diguanylate cyclase [bacterium]|nr:MAG: diguanylate cyclase [bacterium]
MGVELATEAIDSLGKVLVIDDDMTNSVIVADILRGYGYETRYVASGADGVGMAGKWNPDVILLDLLMPVMDGYETCARIRELNNSPRPSVIVVSAKYDKGSIVKALSSGADDFITKPVNEAELVERIRAQRRISGFYTDMEQDTKNLEKIVEITGAISSTLDPNEVLKIVVSKVAEAMGAMRCSLVLIVSPQEAYVLASHDNPEVRDLRIDLNRYPEIKEAIASKKVFTLDNMASNPIMDPVKESVTKLKDMSVLIAPIVFDDEVLGTVFLRARRKNGFSSKEKDFCRIVANTAFHAIRNARLFEKILIEKERLREMAIKDYLTALYNHNFFYTRLEEEFERAVRYELPLALIMMDIDDFKRINDTYGHRVGDNVLKDMAAMIKMAGRKTDIVARYGGEEFAVILPHTAIEGGSEEAERLRSLIEGHTYAGLLKDKITVSLGVAAYPAPGIMNAGDLVTRADNALYSAKRAGKNLVVVCDGKEDK